MDNNKELLLLENPSYQFFRKIAKKLPYNFRQKVKNLELPKILDFIKWVLIDLQRPRFFHPYGLHFFVGLPGKGKTMFMSYQLQEFRKKYGNDIYIATNYGFKGEDFQVNGYEDIIKNYDKPIIIGYDEIQNDFDARQWANLDRGISEKITQSRKLNGMMILATAQKFGFVDRRLRELTHVVYQCNTLLNRLTFAILYEPQTVSKLEEGKYEEHNKIRTKGFKYFVQSDKLRNTYNSYQILQNLQKRLKEYENSANKTIADITELVAPFSSPPS